ncbi:hypothetical protein PFMC_06055, partial [Plasmodium falciparum CAMP/Malaysia]
MFKLIICPPPPCEIVDKTLGDKSSMGYVEGCRKKYMTRGLEGWECNSGNEDGDVCIPPRRQKLYVYELETFNGKTQEDLRQAFIKSAAVETFFSWHEFKKEKEIENKEKAQLVYKTTGPNEFDKKLESGEIPEEFKRRMCYTLGDYRDIFFGKDLIKDKDNNNISTKITEILKKEKEGHKSPTAEEWWTKYAKDIWEGMLCALSYDTKTKIKNQDVYTQLTSTGKKNTYETVIFEGGFNRDKTPKTAITKVEDFSRRPTYFRWLQEWGEEFCRKRKIKLDKIIYECRGDRGGHYYCSGDGYDCTDNDPKYNNINASLNCRDCHEQCTNYKKWIKNKQKEYDNQKKKYKMEITKLQVNSPNNKHDKEFYKDIIEKNGYLCVEDFLKSLNHCNADQSNNDQDNKIDFNVPLKTFSPSTYCKACPLYGLKKIKGIYKPIDEEDYKGNEGSETKENDKSPTDIEVLVLGHKGDLNDKQLNNDCTNTGLFQDSSFQKWICKKKHGIHECKINDVVETKYFDEKIPFKILFERWIIEFIEGYNKLKSKISSCVIKKDGKSNKCIEGCTGKCECVGKWLEKKAKEWNEIKEYYKKQTNSYSYDFAYKVKSFFEQQPFDSYAEEAKKVFDNEIEEDDMWGCTGNIICDSEHKEKVYEDFITKLLERLQKKIETCKEKNKQNDSTCEAPPTGTPNPPDISLPPHIHPPPFCNVPPNPCGDKDATNVVGVEVVAEILHQEAKDTMVKNSVVGSSDKAKGAKKVQDKSESVLKGDISQAQFKKGITGTGLNSECDITDQHTNDSRHGTNAYKGPCTGKDRDNNGVRMKIGTPWKPGSQIQMSAEDIYMPPRRQHMCTSNLEKLHVESVTKEDKASHSLLGDVLLSAKMDAQKIKNVYKEQNDKSELTDENDKATICRAIRYSFADIADIIRGRDLWEKNGDAKRLQGYLKTVFGNIYNSLKKKHPSVAEKYSQDDSDYIKIREDWWEANRAKIWEAMKCSIKDLNVLSSEGKLSDYCGYSDHTPLDDYIPQRLRWMTEWAEWYCKEQSRAYTTLVNGCKQCREMGGKCMKDDGKCEKCTQACNTYKQKIKKWEDQWKEISKKYKTLYQQAKGSVNGATTSSTTDEKDKDVVAFLKQLHEKNKDSNKIYETAEGYIHQEAHNSDCQKQTRFCKNPSGNTSSGNTSSGKDDNKEYAFSLEPHEYKGACKCKDRPQQEDGGSVGRNETFDETTRTKSTPASEDEEDDDDNLENDDNEDAEGDDVDQDSRHEESGPPAPAGESLARSLPPLPTGKEVEDDDDDDDDDGSDVEEEEEEDDEDEVESDEDSEGEVEESEEETEEAEDTGRGEESPQPAAPAAPQPPTPQLLDDPLLKTALMSSTILWMVGIGFAALTYFLLKKKSKSSVDLLRVLNIPKGDYEMPTLKSKNRYIPYRSGQYKGKTYIYMEGDTSGDEDKYMFLSDTTDITSSESEYEELDINDIYAPRAPKYKTLIEVVLEPSKRDTPSSDAPMNKFTDDEWNQLKQDFISGILENEQKDLPKNNISGNTPMNTQPNTLYFNKPEEKPFITSIHDRNLYSGEEISYNIDMSTNSMDDGQYVSNNVYSGIDLINDTLSGNQHIDIYDEVLKRKENELFGTNYKKNISNNSVAKELCGDPIMNQINLLHKWLDRHRDMCEKWNTKEELLDKLNEQWNKDNDGGDIPNDNKKLNTDVSIQIDMDDPKPINQFSNMDINVDTPTMDNMEDDIYYDVNDNDDDNDQPS